MVLQMNCDIKRNQAGTAWAPFLDEFLLAVRGSLQDAPAHYWWTLTRQHAAEEWACLTDSLLPKFSINVGEGTDYY